MARSWKLRCSLKHWGLKWCYYEVTNLVLDLFTIIAPPHGLLITATHIRHLRKLAPDRFNPEKQHQANAGLHLAQEFLEPVKKQFPWITYADLWTLAGAQAIEEMGGVPDGCHAADLMLACKAACAGYKVFLAHLHAYAQLYTPHLIRSSGPVEHGKCCTPLACLFADTDSPDLVTGAVLHCASHVQHQQLCTSSIPSHSS